MTSVVLNFQEPAGAGSLLEALLEACSGARNGGAAFAFATTDGVSLLLESRDFRSFLARSEEFQLVIGVDAITNIAALEAIQAIHAPSLVARVFLHDRRPLFFHPKLAWFQRPRGRLTMVVGSGNLTRGGLRANWEAFTVVTVGGREATRLERSIERWLNRVEPVLRSLDDDEVRQRAGRNTGRERDAQVPAPVEGRRLEREEARAFDSGQPILIAELSKGGTRPTQANFHLEHYESYFRARRGSRRVITLNRVEPDGVLAEAESKNSVEARSKNYRFELAEAFAGREYPEQGPPIAVFVRTDSGGFLYRLVFPDETGHVELTAFLAARKPNPGRMMRQERATVAELRAAWPDSVVLRPKPSSQGA